MLFRELGSAAFLLQSKRSIADRHVLPEARSAARDLAELARLLDQAVLRVGRVLFRAYGRGAGPSARNLKAACRLYLVSWHEGSAVAGFDLAEPQPGKASFRDIGEHSLRHFVAGLAWVAAEQAPGGLLPDGFDSGVLATCVALGRLLDHGIETFSLTEPSRRQTPSACYDAAARQRIHALLERGSRAELDMTLHRQTLRGEPDVSAASPAFERSFWKSASLDELAAHQGVLPIADISELDEVWSEGDVFDDALSEVLRDRAHREEGRARQ